MRVAALTAMIFLCCLVAGAWIAAGVIKHTPEPSSQVEWGKSR